MKNRTIGYILISPAILSIPLLVLNLLDKQWDLMSNLSFNWTGDFATGGASSSIPFYFGLMAIAGAILLSRSENKNYTL